MQEKLNRQLVWLFNRLLQQEEHALAQSAKDLSLREIHCIEQVCEGDRASTMGELAENLGITLGTLTVCVNRLEFKGYVRRRKDAHDRRVVRVSPTEKALAVNELHQAFHRGMVREITQPLSKEDLQRLYEMLARIEDYFERRAQDEEKKHGR